MGDYTNMSAYYDLIMTSGYYDYEKIVENIVRDGDFDSVLEIGCGTGLILKELVQKRPAADIMGVDLTEAMLSIEPPPASALCASKGSQREARR